MWDTCVRVGRLVWGLVAPIKWFLLLVVVGGLASWVVCDARQEETSKPSGVAPRVFTAQEARERGLVSQEGERRAALWRQRSEHWDTLQSMDGVLGRVQADRVIDLGEYRKMCVVLPQWREQLQGVAAYARQLVQVDEETAKALFDAVDRRQDLLAEFRAPCANLQPF